MNENGEMNTGVVQPAIVPDEMEPETPMGVYFYGILAWVLELAPTVVYILRKEDTNKKFKQYHKTWIQMCVTSYTQMTIVFLMFLCDDTDRIRGAWKSAVEMARTGPFGLLWVGLWSFLMYASNDKKLDQNQNRFWAILYSLLNVGLLIIHYHFSPEIIKWSEKKAPVKEKPLAPKSTGTTTTTTTPDSTDAKDDDKKDTDAMNTKNGNGQNGQNGKNGQPEVNDNLFDSEF